MASADPCTECSAGQVQPLKAGAQEPRGDNGTFHNALKWGEGLPWSHPADGETPTCQFSKVTSPLHAGTPGTLWQPTSPSRRPTVLLDGDSSYL